MAFHLRELRLDRFRNVVPGTTLRFHPGTNVVLGKNGSGKTTVLKVLEAVLSGNWRLFHDERAALHAVFEGSWRWHPQQPEHRGTVRFAYDATRPDGNGVEEQVAFEVVRSDGQRATLNYGNGEWVACMADREIGRRTSEAPNAIETWLVGDGTEWRTEWRHAMHPFASIERFPEDLAMYDALVNGTLSVADAPGRTLEVADTGVAGLLGWGGGPFTEFLDLQRYPVGAPLPREEKVPGTRLHEAAARMGFAGAEVVLRAQDTGAQPVVYDLQFSLQRRDGTWVRQDRLSWGQKRFLAWWVRPDGPYAIADELTNGLHHEWIDAVLERIAGRQVFLATQNPLLLDHLEFANEEEVRQRIVCCRVQDGSPREQLVWSNPTEDQARAFFAAYEVGIQHVSEILRMQDLW